MMFGILGYGFVGKATKLGLDLPDDTTIHDIDLGTDRSILDSAETVFVCLPTETDSDIDVLISEVQQLKADTVIIRSTLPLGTCKRINKSCVIYMPEFLRERHWKTDCLNRPLVVGCDSNIPTWLKYDEDIVECSTLEAELVKMFSNNLAVMRIAFANIFYDIANNVDADYNNVKDMFLAVQPKQSYLDVPGLDGKQGFAGKCLPKDLDFLISTMNSLDMNTNIFEQVKELNKGWRDV
jgi:UDPglucose 6-dehydrogenase|tara:strand:+ start:2870 stop:3583 length:714 start_codon:yes stop_codon:yes gene_type:complete